MADIDVQIGPPTNLVNGECALEDKLRRLFAEQVRLREQLEQTRAELDHVNAEVLRTQDEYCTTPEKEDEYCQCLKKIIGYDPRDMLKEIEEAKRNPQSVKDILAELERTSG